MIGNLVLPRWAILVAISISFTTVGYSQMPVDSDGDGLPDQLEQSLLEKFRPSFMTSATDCADKPARFRPGQAHPEPMAKDGTIYGQVFPATGANRVEIHYYTLWTRDCGRKSHPWDVEHVSALVDTSAEPKALYWYAGAHENTACDISSGARATTIGAETRGPRVWSSSGKHAMFFKAEMCGHGCGADSCDNPTELPASNPVVNLGERTAPMNGSAWVTSTQWMLPAKMDSDFPPAMLARLDASSPELVTTLRGRSSVRGTIQVSDVVLGSAGTGVQHTGDALDTANAHTSKSLGTAKRATGNSLKRAWNAVFGRKQSTPESAKPTPK